MSRVKETVVGVLLGVVISKAFDVWGVTEAIEETLEDMKKGNKV